MKNNRKNNILLIALFSLLTLVLGWSQGCGNGNTTGTSGKGPTPSKPGPDPDKGDPVNIYTGNESKEVIDLQVFGSLLPLEWKRHGNSRLASYDSYGFGHYWKSGYQWDFDECWDHPLGYAQKIIYYPDGAQIIFANISGDQWVSRAGISDELWKVGVNFELRTKTGRKMVFTPHPTPNAYKKFLMTKIVEANGLELQLEYNLQNQVTKVTEPGGRWIQAVYQWVAGEKLIVPTVGQVNQVPASGTWMEILVSNPIANRYARVMSSDLASGSIAEVEFYDENNQKLSGNVISSDGVIEAQKALDEDPNTYFQSAGVSGGFVGFDWGTAKKVAKMRVLARAGDESKMVTQGFEYQPVRLQVGDFRTDWSLSTLYIQASDGRRVDYHYQNQNDVSIAGSYYSVLKEVLYPDATKAIYTYGQDFSGQRPLVTEYNDPRSTLRQKRSQTVYQSDRSNGIGGILGMVQKQVNPITGGTILELGFEGHMHRPKVTYANGGSEWEEFDYVLAGTTNYGIAGALITKSRDLRGNITQYQYDGYGYAAQVTDPLGRIRLVERNSFSNLTKITEPDGSYQTWSYDLRQQVLSYRDHLGRITTYTRDSQSRVTRIDYADSSYETFTYNALSQILTHRFRNGGTENYTYDLRGLLTQKNDPLGNLTQYTYDSLDRVATVTDARGLTTSFLYNDRGQITKMTHPDGSFKAMVYDSYGNLTSETNELGNSSLFAYDIFQRVITSTDPLGRITTVDYLVNSFEKEPLQITLPSGKKIGMTYDLGWNKLSQTTGLGTADASTTTYQYDAVNNPIQMTDGQGKSWTTIYDNRDRKINALDPLGNTTTWSYDFEGNVLTVKDALNRITTNNYDSMNRLSSTTDAKNQTTTYFYDSASNLIKMVDAKNNQYQNSFDLLNRKTAMIYPDNSQEQYGYDSVSNLVTYTTRAGQVKTCTFDNRNREILCDWSDSTPDVTRTFDALGRLEASNNGVSSITYQYNAANELLSELTQVAGGQPRAVAYTYTVDGNRASVTYPDGSVVSYGYTGRNQISGINDGGTQLVGYSYNLNGDRIQKALNNGTSTEYTFDDASRLTGLTDKKGATTLLTTAYTLNAVGNRTAKAQDGVNETYSFDNIDQVSGVSYSGTATAARTVAYNYDATGNRTSVIDNGATSTYSANNLNQYSSVTSASSAVTNLGYDSNGNLINGGTLQSGLFFYDAQNRLTRAIVSGNTTDFDYDSKNRVVKRSLNSTPTFLVYDGWNLSKSVLRQAQYLLDTFTEHRLTKSSPRPIQVE